MKQRRFQVPTRRCHHRAGMLELAGEDEPGGDSLERRERIRFRERGKHKKRKLEVICRGSKGIYTPMILCESIHPSIVYSLFLNPLILLYFWSNGSWMFHLTHMFVFLSDPRDQDHMAVMDSTVIKSESSDLSDGWDLSSPFLIHFHYLHYVLPFLLLKLFSQNSQKIFSAYVVCLFYCLSSFIYLALLFYFSLFISFFFIIFSV